jgi:phenylalanyl-tRNA synthetase beta chain
MMSIPLSFHISAYIINTMRVPFEWLRDFLDITEDPVQLSGRLTMIGLEVEGIEQFGSDPVFEVNVTPNRPDCLSMLGVARELSASYGVPLTLPKHEIPLEETLQPVSVEIFSPELCHRYAGRFISEVVVSESPEWLKERLEKCGIRSINNIVDITNYVLLEFGHPLHAFDADTIEGGTIRVGAAGKSMRFSTLDGIERNLKGDMLLIWDKEKPIAIAGVMGGLNTEVSAATVNVFLESAYFSPVSVRKTSKSLNLKSESSYRFERGADILFLESALDRTAFLIQELAGGKVHKITDVYPVQYSPEPVHIECKRINRLLGTEITENEMLDILSRLGIPAEKNGHAMTVFPPSHRRDIQRESDIAEEIARMYGYNKIPVTIPSSPVISGRTVKNWRITENIRQTIRKTGFTEVVNYSFMNMSDLDLMNVTVTDQRRHAVELNNPLNQENRYLRTTLVPALLRNLLYNLDKGNSDIRLFEISKKFEESGEPLPNESLSLAAIAYREPSPSLWKDDAPSFYLMKGVINVLCEEYKIEACSFEKTSEPFLHEGQSADVVIDGRKVGFAGVLRPEIIEQLDLKKRKSSISLCELDIGTILLHARETIQFKSLPRYPSIERDIAIIIDEHVPSAFVHETILSFPSELIREVSVFDVYKGKNIPKGKKSLAFNIIYRAHERTLTDDEVEQLHSSLVAHVLKKTGGELRADPSHVSS